MTVSGTQRVWPMCIALAVAVAAVCISMQLSMIITLASIALAAYLPSYVDGAEYTGERFWPRFAEFMRERAVFPHTLEHEEPLDATKQYIYCSHPHGLISAHHGNMLAGSTAPCTMPIVAMWRVVLLKDLTGLTLCSLCSLAFHDASPMHTRRHLAASVCFRIPFYREYLLWLGCVDARRNIAEKVRTHDVMKMQSPHLLMAIPPDRCCARERVS